MWTVLRSRMPQGRWLRQGVWELEGLDPMAGLALGSLGGVAGALLGGWNVVRRDVL